MRITLDEKDQQELDEMARQLLALRVKINESLTLTVEEAAEALRIGRSAAYKAVKSGDVPSIRIGKKYIIPTAPLRKLLGI